MLEDDPFRSAPLRFPEPPRAHPRPWPSVSRLQQMRHGVMVLGIATMSFAMIVPIRPLPLYRITSCGEPRAESFPLCGHSCSALVARDLVARDLDAELRTGVMAALLVAFVGFLLGHSHWLVRSHDQRPAGVQWARANALLALTYAALGFLLTAFWAPYSVERPVLTPIFLALCGVTLITRPE